MTPSNPRLSGSWNHPQYVREQLEKLGYKNIAITPHAYEHTAPSPDIMAKKMRHAIMLHTLGWGVERKEKGWELRQAVESVLRAQQGDCEVKVTSVVLLITAQRGHIME